MDKRNSAYAQNSVGNDNAFPWDSNIVYDDQEKAAGQKDSSVDSAQPTASDGATDIGNDEKEKASGQKVNSKDSIRATPSDDVTVGLPQITTLTHYEEKNLQLSEELIHGVLRQ